MKSSRDGVTFTATDLAAFLECNHRTVLELAVADGSLVRPAQNDLERRLLELRGHDHEARVLEWYRASGKNIVDLTNGSANDTLTAMAAGADVIYQGQIAHAGWSGRPDFLVKGSGASRNWPHHYEVVDAKLSREAKARAVLQLCVYTDQLTNIQGRAPQHFHIATGGEDVAPVPCLADDFMAYYRTVRGRFGAFVANGDGQPYPEPVEHCAVCPWWKRCEERRTKDDHLSLVAGITRRQRDRLQTAGIIQVAQLGALPIERSIEGISTDALSRVREQARLQAKGRSWAKGDPGTRWTQHPQRHAPVYAPGARGASRCHPAAEPGRNGKPVTTGFHRSAKGESIR